MAQGDAVTITDGDSSQDSWQQQRVYADAERYFTELFAALRSARETVLLEYYIFEMDAVGEQLLAELARAVDRGVVVKVLFDGIGSSRSGERVAKALEASGCEVKIFHPLPWNISHYPYSLFGGSYLQKLYYFTRYINRRTHRKLCLIDGEQVWSGSLNICHEHLPVSAGGEGWRDYGVCAEGAAAASIAAHFEALWHRQRPKFRRGLFRYYWNNFGAWMRRRKNRLLVRAIERSRQRLWIASAYFAPSVAVSRAIERAARRGVEVKLLVPSRSDVGLFPHLTRSYYRDLLVAGVQVFEYQSGVLHGKALIADQFFLLGSTNFNHRSFLHDLELDVVLVKASAQQQLESFMVADFTAAEPVLARSGWRHSRMISALLRRLRYWM